MIYQATRFPSPLANLVRQTARAGPVPRSPFPFPSPSSFRFQSKPRSLCTATPTYTHQSTSFLSSYRLALFASLPLTALTLSNLNTESRALQCASDRSYAYGSSSPVEKAANAASGEYKEAESILNLRDMGFSTVAGICCGVFVKKGLRVSSPYLSYAFERLEYTDERDSTT